MQIDSNPLVVPILHCLQRQQQALSEHDLITALKPQLDELVAPSTEPQLALFRTHFLVMNALYQLQRDLFDDGLVLSISPLQIQLQPAQGTGQTLPEDSGSAALAEYYLDWSNLRDTDAGDVERLLGEFWQRYLAHDQHHEALSVLGLSAGADWSQIQASYRRLSSRLHPDRGGDSQAFIRVREAYEILRRVLAP